MLTSHSSSRLGGLHQTPAGTRPPQDQTPSPGPGTPPWTRHPLEQTPPGPDTPQDQAPVNILPCPKLRLRAVTIRNTFEQLHFTFKAQQLLGRQSPFVNCQDVLPIISGNVVLPWLIQGRAPRARFLYYRPQRICSKVMFLHLSVILFMGGGGLCPGGGSVRVGGLFPRGSLSSGVSVQGNSVKETLDPPLDSYPPLGNQKSLISFGLGGELKNM